MASNANDPTANGLTVAVTEKFTVPVLNKAGEEVGSVEIDPVDFGGKINKQLLHDVVLMYQARARAGTHSTLRRGEVAGSTKKLFRQKGTGYARVGNKRTNKRRGGGTAKGPKPRDYNYSMPKRAIRAATKMALLSRLKDGEVVILDELELEAPKTKEMANILKGIKVGTKVASNKRTGESREVELTLYDIPLLIGTAEYNLNVYKSGRNIEGVSVLPAAEFNAHAILRPKKVVLTKAALEQIGRAHV